MAATGFGTTITFSTGFFAEITNVDWDGFERANIDTSHMLTTEGWMTFTPSDLKDPGQMTVQLYYNPQTALPITSAAETVTLTYPNGATDVCQGYLQAASRAIPHDEKMTCVAVIKFSGKPVHTAA